MEIKVSDEQLQRDVAIIQRIPVVPTLLDVICRTTGMGFAAIARVTEDKWITCGVHDSILFGLKPGDELNVETTICHEIQQSGKTVVIDDVDKSEVFCNHPTPLMYGFKSYISVPIIRKDGSFFGTLCAIDPKPARLNTPEVINTFNLFADLISFHLNAIEQLEVSKEALSLERIEKTKALELKNEELQKMNAELETFAYIASHDLQEPLRKINTFSSRILAKDFDNLSEDGKNYFNRLIDSVKRMQTLIDDLLSYTRINARERIFEKIHLNSIVDEIIKEYQDDLTQKTVTFEIGELCIAEIIPIQFYQLLQNLIQNSIKFSKPGIDTIIQITGSIKKGDKNLSDKLLPEKNYCHLTVVDNGIGFETQYSEKIFMIFQRLHGRKEYNGTGIGLSIVKKIVENHNGFITAAGETDKGAKFDIYIPQP